MSCLQKDSPVRKLKKCCLFDVAVVLVVSIIVC